ncbi:MAG TPA: hypothetical protein VNK52_08375 [Hyphomicrobiaceae bacterium]|nr:hypothetical protein [Hyphomicrobiaceae bacterium]
MDIEAEIEGLKRRVSDLEGALNVLTGQLREVHPNLSGLRTETNERFDRVVSLMGRIVNRLDDVNLQVWSLRDDFPGMLSAALDQARRHPPGESRSA